MNKTESIGFRAYLATSFLGAFNDNFFKLLLTCFAMNVLPKELHNTYVPLAGGIFVLPFLLFSSYGGWISDFWDKRKVMIWAKWMELAVMLLGFLLFHASAVYWLLLALFLMGAQSALYSPAKYGYLPEALPEEELPNGSGLTMLTTFIAIIAGTSAGGFISDRFGTSPSIGGFLAVVVAAIGVITSGKIGKTPRGNPNAQFSWNPIATHWRTFQLIRKHPRLFFSIFGATYFWLFSALFQNNLPLFIRNSLGLGDKELGYALGAVGLGIGLGCAISGKLAHGKIRITWAFPGGIAMSVCAILMGFFCKGCVSAVLFSLLLGMCAGFYQLPLSTAVTQDSPSAHRGACLSLSNAIDCISMLLAYFAQWLLLHVFRLSPAGVFCALGFATIVFVVLWTQRCKGETWFA